jgi:hypothetical protein
MPTQSGKTSPGDDDSDFQNIPDVRRAHDYAKKTRTGLDYTFPPMSDLEDIFNDISNRAVKKGLKTFLAHLGHRKLRVVTMCSGTESPIMALEMIAQSRLLILVQKASVLLLIYYFIGLKSQHNIAFEFEHLFSVEIVPFKQAYIERNFHPPFLFRDVRELCNTHA